MSFGRFLLFFIIFTILINVGSYYFKTEQSISSGKNANVGITLTEGWQLKNSGPNAIRCLAMPKYTVFKGFPYIYERIATPCGDYGTNTNGLIYNLIFSVAFSALIASVLSRKKQL